MFWQFAVDNGFGEMAQPAQNAATRSRPPPFGDGKLDGTNYTLWKFKIRAILDSYELWETANGVDVKPGPTADPNDPSQTLPPDPTLALAWKRRNADALCAIVTVLVIW